MKIKSLKQREKKGMSQAATTILIVLFAIAAIGGIWVYAGGFFEGGISKLWLDPITIDLKIESAIINLTGEVNNAEIKVARNPGEGEVLGILFILEDNQNQEIYEKRFDSFEEYEKHTATIDLSTTTLNLQEVTKISIAPIYFNEKTNEEIIGKVEDEITGIKDLTISQQAGGEGGEGQFCNVDNPCPAGGYTGDPSCQDTSTVVQDLTTYQCISNICVGQTENLVKKDICLSGYECSLGTCVVINPPCSTDTDCPADDFVGSPSCDQSPWRIVQDYRDYSCVNEGCTFSDTQTTLETCIGSEVCQNGACFEPLECVNDRDCKAIHNSACYECVDGTCEARTTIDSGTINTVWPVGVAEYFDSTDLDNNGLIHTFLNFPGSAEDRCLQVTDFYYTDLITERPYIKINESNSSLSDGDSFEIWQNECACEQL